jgi:hypothetical protein
MKTIVMTQGSYTHGHVATLNDKGNDTGHFTSKRAQQGDSFEVDDAEARRLVDLGVAEFASRADAAQAKASR